MRSVERQVDKPRLRLISADEVDGSIGNKTGGVTSNVAFFDALLKIVFQIVAVSFQSDVA